VKKLRRLGRRILNEAKIDIDLLSDVKLKSEKRRGLIGMKSDNE